MKETFKRVHSFLQKIKMTLTLSGFVFAGGILTLNRLDAFPLNFIDFCFFSILVFLIALYRFGWVFLMFVGSLPFEIIGMSPTSLSWSLRPYQWLGALALSGFFVRVLLRSTPHDKKYLQWNIADSLISFMFVSGGITAVSVSANQGANLKQFLVLAVCIALYALTRISIRTLADALQALSFATGSFVLTGLYALWQNIAYLQNRPSFEVMAGRPNAFFTEPDWLGLFAVICIALLYTVLAVSRATLSFKYVAYFTFLILADTILILTISRSAWLGVIAMTVVAMIIVASQPSLKLLRYGAHIGGAFIFSIVIVLLAHLTPFALSDRLQSSASGLQTITVACAHDETRLPAAIEDVDELASFDCKHINIEEIEQWQSIGYNIREVSRHDPNVSIRKNIYAQVFRIAKTHWFGGIGFANIGIMLGDDERGMNLNASNILLEVWLGTGLIGALAFIALWINIFWSLIKILIVRKPAGENDAFKILQPMFFFLAVSWMGYTVFNMFNAGIFLGFFWVWLALAVSFTTKKIRV